MLRSVSCPSADVCVAVGSSGDGRALVERWNRGRWSVQRLSWLAADLLSVSCPSIRVCVAVGATSSGPNAVVERWNERVWSLQQTPTPLALRHRRGDEAFFGVSCASVRFCTAVGSVDARSVTPLAERWDGSRWSLEGTPTLRFPNGMPGDGYFKVVSCPTAKVCIAAGSGPTTNPLLVERWNGAAWAIQSIPVDLGPGSYDADAEGLSCTNGDAMFARSRSASP